MINPNHKTEAEQHFSDGVKTLIALKVDEATRKMSGQPLSPEEAAKRMLERAKLFRAIEEISIALNLHESGQIMAIPPSLTLSHPELSLLVDYFLAHEVAQITKAIGIAKTLVGLNQTNSPAIKALAAL